MSNVFLMPNEILSGINAIDLLEPHIKDKGNKVLIVTDEVMTKIGNVERLSNILDNCDITYEVYDEVNCEPTDVIVEKGVKVFKQADCKFIIALGGGSPIDAAKAIAFMSVSNGKISDYTDKSIYSEIPYLIAIPTTAGTGSEVTQFTIITDTKNNVKMLLKGPSLLPKLAVVDPGLTLTTPPMVTVATGIDALTHAIEAYTSIRAQPLSDIFALSAIKRIYGNLKIAYKDGQNIEAKYELSLGALEAGIAFNNSSVTIVHGMSRPIGAIFHIPHGISNAILLTECLEFAIHGNVARFADIARAIGIYQKDMTQLEAAQQLVCEIGGFCIELQVPTLEEMDVSKDEFDRNLDKIAEDALESGSPANGFRCPCKQEIIEIYKKIWK